jgi:Lon-like protease
VAALLWYIPSDHYVFLPNAARDVDELVAVPGENAEDDTSGIYMVDIRVRKASLLERLVPAARDDGASLVPEERVNPVGVSEQERREQSLNEMSRSQQIAVAVALRELGYEVDVRPIGAEVVLVLPGSPADGELDVGDVIVSVRGTPVQTPEEVADAMEHVRPGQSVVWEIRRDGRTREITLETRAAEDDPGRAVVGVQIEEAAEIHFPLEIRIDAGDVGGPSAGLAFALDVVDELGREVDRGRRIAVTGALDLRGNVEAIGGVKQKAFGARLVDADVFVVPEDNAAEARRYAGDLRVVAVSTFSETLTALATM